MPTGTPIHHISGSDRTVPLPSRTTYAHDPYNPKPKTSTFDWGTTTDQTVWDEANGKTPKPAKAKRQTPAPKARKPRATKPRAPKKPRQPAAPTHDTCDCGNTKLANSIRCRACSNQHRRDNATGPNPALRRQGTCIDCGQPCMTGARRCRPCHARYASPHRQGHHPIDLDTLIREYTAGATVPAIARDHGWAIKSIRDQLRRAGVTMRDDRRTNSGGKPIEHDNPDLIEAVRHHYVDLHQSQSEVATSLGIGFRAVQRLMARHGIKGRTGMSGATDNQAGYRERMTRLGVTPAQVRAWALANGHHPPPRGRLSDPVLDAYEKNQPTTKENA